MGLKNGKNHRSSELNSSEYVLVPKSRAIEKIRKAIDVTEATLDMGSSGDRLARASILGNRILLSDYSACILRFFKWTSRPILLYCIIVRNVYNYRFSIFMISYQSLNK
jgi:hypothetical protein